MGKLRLRLQDASRSGVYRVTRADEVLDAVQGSALELARVRFADKPRLLQSLADALAFPDWFGHNWDALEDCLSDFSWREAAGTVLLFDDPQPGEDLEMLVDILRASAAHWAERGKPFFAVFVDPRRVLSAPELFRQA